MVMNCLLALLVVVLWGIALAGQSDEKVNWNGKRLGNRKVPPFQGLRELERSKNQPDFPFSQGGDT